MVDLSTATPLGTTASNSTPLYQLEWGYLAGESIPDGVLGDTTGNGWQVYASGSNTNIVVKPGGASLAVRGTLGRNTTDITLDVAAFGTAPTSGQTRIDLVIVRKDLTARKVLVTVLPGDPATSGATAPSLTRNPAATWEYALAKVVRTGNTSVTQAMVTRLTPWSGRHLAQVADAASLPGDAPMGTTATVGPDWWERAPAGRDTSGNATGITWWNRSNPPFSASGWSFATGMKANGPTATPRFRAAHGRIEALGQVTRTTGADFPHAPIHLGVLPASVAAGLTTETRFGQAATNTSDGCRLYAVPQPGGQAWLYALCPLGVSVIVLDGWSVPIA